jgi:hypothetical protein
MEKTFKETKLLCHLQIRVPKDDAYFVYFTFESNEGLCFYSTLDESLRGPYRDMDIKCTIEMQSTLMNLIARLQTQMRLDILVNEIISDF